MGVFVVLFLIPLAVQYMTLGNKHIDYEKKNKRALTVFFVILAFLLVLRHESVGSDTRNYIRFFERVSLMNWSEAGRYSIEWGFSYFAKLIGVFFEQPQVFIGITAILSCSLVGFAYRRLCVDASFTIVLFCNMATFVMMFSGIRQMIAIAIGFLAYECTRRKRLVGFIVCVLIAMLFHTSAFMLFFMYPLYRVKITRKWLMFVVPILAMVFVWNQQIFSFLMAILERFTEYEGIITQTGAYTMLILFAMFAVFSFVIPDESSLDEETVGLRNFLLFSVALQMFAPLHTIAMRMNYYYIIFIPLLLPRIIACRSERWRMVALIGKYVMLVFFIGYFFWNASTGGSLKVFPYHFFWETVR